MVTLNFRIFLCCHCIFLALQIKKKKKGNHKKLLDLFEYYLVAVQDVKASVILECYHEINMLSHVLCESIQKLWLVFVKPYDLHLLYQ